MTQANDYDGSVWERMFDFAFSDERNMTREEVQAELRRLRIDVQPAVSNIHDALAHARESRDARESLKRAGKERLSTVAKLTGLEVPSFPEMRAELVRMIRECLSGSQQALYARKLENAASDEDLRSLLEDISRLKSFSDEGGHAER